MSLNVFDLFDHHHLFDHLILLLAKCINSFSVYNVENTEEKPS